MSRRTADVAAATIHEELRSFREFGKDTVVVETSVSGSAPVPTYVNEWWTAGQRQAHSLHEVSYRACFKPQLPRFFIDRLTRPGDLVHDPFMGRGTTPLEAALAGRRAAGSDASPVAMALAIPRFEPPDEDQVRERLREMLPDMTRRHAEDPLDADLRAFFHPETLEQLKGVRAFVADREAQGLADRTDRWIRMVVLSRLTGHSPGFLSVYTLPPNQAVSAQAQRRLNAKKRQRPPLRHVAPLVIRKTRSLLADVDQETLAALRNADPYLVPGRADRQSLRDGLARLVVTSPPFLDVVDYATDNWIRSWLLGVDPAAVGLSVHGRLQDWQDMVASALRETMRVLAPGGFLAFEVGEVRGGKVRLEETVLPCAQRVGLEAVLLLVNAQEFTKTAACWGVANGSKGTNTNRVVLLRRPVGGAG